MDFLWYLNEWIQAIYVPVELYFYFG